MNLEGKTVLVTGASRGLGRALSERLAAEGGVRVLCGVRDPASFRPIVGDVHVVELDLGSRERIEAGVAALGPERDRIDVLVNNAGLFVGGLLERQPLDDVYAMLQVNVAGVIHLTHALLPSLQRRPEAKIVNQASIVSQLHFPGISTYSATKAAIAAFTESLRRELAETSVSVLHLDTGGMDTEMLELADEQLREHMDPDRWERQDAHSWADRIVQAIADDDEVLHTGGGSRAVELLGKAPAKVLDAVAKRAFHR
jgi:NAD(P)-dependent dehydrogenase (short-subunit alcohol dehydrogenase family)